MGKVTLYNLLDVKPPELISCVNCGKPFEKFRKQDPFTKTCKKCILNAWHIPLEDRKKYCKIASFQREIKKLAPISKPEPFRATTLKRSNVILDLEIILKLTKKELEMIKLCCNLEPELRYAFYHRIENVDPNNEWLRFLKNW